MKVVIRKNPDGTDELSFKAETGEEGIVLAEIVKEATRGGGLPSVEDMVDGLERRGYELVSAVPISQKENS